MTAFCTTLLVLAPALAAALIAVVRPSPRRAAALSATASGLSVVLAGALLGGGMPRVVTFWSWAPELFFEVSWRLDTATLALAVLVAAIGLLVLLYAGSYFTSETDAWGTIALLAAFESAMLGLVLADNLLLLFVFWELTGLCSFFLISSDRSKGEIGLRAAGQALLVTVAGGLSLLVAVVYLSWLTGSASLSALLTVELEPAARTVALALVLPAVLTKSAQIPTHFWLPGAMAAPTPVSAYLHSATMVKAGIVLLLYLYPLLGASPLWTWSLLPIGAATCLWGAVRALGESDIKLLMAWSTVSQLGLLTLTIGLGTDIAIRAAVLHLFAHAVFKAGLFLTVGGVDHAAHTRSLPELGGLRRRTPLLAAAAAVLAGSMAGIPPLAGFLSKELILKKAMLTDLWVHAIAVTAIVAGAVGTVAYSSRFFFEVFTGRPRSARAASAERLPAGLLAAPLVLAGVTALAGPGARWVDRWFLEPVAFAIVRAPLEVKPLSLWYGINVTLLLSLAIVSAGYLADRLLGLRFLGSARRRLPSGADLFESSMERSQRLGEATVRILAAASPRTYLALAVAAGLLPALLLSPELREVSWKSAAGPGVALVIALGGLLAALLTAERALPRVLLLTAVGFAVALLFRMMNGPDLMLTQLLVEVTVTIFFALALAALPSELRRWSVHEADRWRWGRLLLATAAGLGAAALVAAVAGTPRSDHVAGFMRETAPAIAKGDNLVNVVLTDVRGLDTLIETLVVVLGGLGVAGLMRGREWAESTRAANLDRLAPADRSGLLPGLAKLILPIGVVFAVVLLVKGHNDTGGGFVAGLSLGVAAMLALLAFGPRAVRRRMTLSLAALAVLGGLLMLAVGAVGLAADGSFLTQFHGQLTLASRSMAWHSTLLFDIGVMLAVAGGIGAAGLALWPLAVRRAGEGKR